MRHPAWSPYPLVLGAMLAAAPAAAAEPFAELLARTRGRARAQTAAAQVAAAALARTLRSAERAAPALRALREGFSARLGPALAALARELGPGHKREISGMLGDALLGALKGTIASSKDLEPAGKVLLETLEECIGELTTLVAGSGVRRFTLRTEKHWKAAAERLRGP